MAEAKKARLFEVKVRDGITSFIKARSKGAARKWFMDGHISVREVGAVEAINIEKTRIEDAD